MSNDMLRSINRQMVRLQVDLPAALHAAAQVAQHVTLWLVSAPFYGIGWLAGFLMRCLLWAVAALVAGYKQGVGK